MRGYYPLIHYGYLWVFNFWDNPSDNMRGYYRMDPLMGVIWIILDNGKFHPLLCKTPMCKFRILNHGFWVFNTFGARDYSDARPPIFFGYWMERPWVWIRSQKLTKWRSLWEAQKQISITEAKWEIISARSTRCVQSRPWSNCTCTSHKGTKEEMKQKTCCSGLGMTSQSLEQRSKPWLNGRPRAWISQRATWAHIRCGSEGPVPCGHNTRTRPSCIQWARWTPSEPDGSACTAPVCSMISALEAFRDSVKEEQRQKDSQFNGIL